MKLIGNWRSSGVWSLLVLTSIACGSSPLKTRIVESPSSEVVSYGAPKDITYSAEADSSLQLVRLVVYRSAKCDVIPVELVDRVEEKLRGDKVVERTVLGKKQVAGSPRGEINCDQSYARNVDVMLEVDGGRYPLGVTDQNGVVTADLARLFKTGEMGSVPREATVVLRPAQAKPTARAGQIHLSQLLAEQQRVGELLDELRVILQAGELTQQNSARAYELYQSLFQLAPTDPRVEGLQMRFWELVFKRRQLETVDNLERNLEALEGARDLLKIMGDAALPIYVQVAVSSGTLDRRALEWSSLRLLSALRGQPQICAQGFSYSKLPSYRFERDVELAARYVEFAYNGSRDPYWSRVCASF